MPVILKLTFPAGRYHATPWGRHVNEGVPEWPPSPWRLLRALIATWRRKCPDLSEKAVRRVLEQLVAPPSFSLPSARVAHTRHYMPWEKKGPDDRTLVFDTFVAISRHDAVFVHWPEAVLSPDDSGAFATLARNLTSLGRAEGWIHAESVDSLPRKCNCAPSAAANTDQELVSVFCPDPGTAFSGEHYPPVPDAKQLKKGLKPGQLLFDCPRWHLCLDTEIIHAERWPRVPGARWVSYARPADVFTKCDVRNDSTSDRYESHTVARFLLDGKVLPLVSDTVCVAEAFRATAMHRFETWCRKQSPESVEPYLRTDCMNRYSSPILTGKDTAGIVLPGHDHAYYLPTAEGADPRRLTHVTVYAPAGFAIGETAALTAIRSLRVDQLELRAQLVGLGRPTDFRAMLFGEAAEPAKVWSSASPFVGPAHIGQRGRERYLKKSVMRELRRWLSRQPTSTEIAAVSRLEETTQTLAGRPRSLDYRRGRHRPGDDGYRRPCGFFRISFSSPIKGPLCLGYSSHYGLGLFLPTYLNVEAEH